MEKKIQEFNAAFVDLAAAYVRRLANKIAGNETYTAEPPTGPLRWGTSLADEMRVVNLLAATIGKMQEASGGELPQGGPADGRTNAADNLAFLRDFLEGKTRWTFPEGTTFNVTVDVNGTSGMETTQKGAEKEPPAGPEPVTLGPGTSFRMENTSASGPRVAEDSKKTDILLALKELCRWSKSKEDGGDSRWKMKTMELRRVPYGTTFTAFGDQFVALDYIGGGVLAIRKETWKNVAFDSNGVNDLRSASIGQALEDYLNTLKDGGAKISDILNMTIDLKATDGTREYGFHETKIGLLTLEQYGKYQHIIPDVEECWWLATPWRTPGEKCGHSTLAWYVNSNGSAYYHDCSCAGYYLRPALILSPSILTSIDDEAEQPAGKTEAETYAEYCAYVMDWAGYAEEGGQDQGTSPLTYEEWKEENEG